MSSSASHGTPGAPPERHGRHAPQFPVAHRFVVAGLAVLVVAVTVLVAGDALRGTAPSGSAGPSNGASGGPSGGPGSPTATSSSAVSSGDWEAVSADTFQPTATLKPTGVTANGRIARTTGFTLASLTGRPAAELLAGLTSQPPIELALAPGTATGATSARIVPKTPLEPGAEYRFALREGDGALVGTWRYIVAAGPKVVETSPGNQATNVPRDVGIEFTFDQDGVGSIAPFLSISPAIQGRFEHRGRVWVFVPQGKLRAATLYTVTLHRGVPLEGSTLAMTEDVAFAFETSGAADPDPAEPVLVSNGSVEVPPGTGAWLEVLAPRPPDEEEGGDDSTPRWVPATSIVLTTYRLPDFAAARAAFTTLEVDDSWVEASDLGLVPTEGLERVASAPYPLRVAPGIWTGSETRIAQLPALPAGWYLVVHPSPRRDQQVLVQVTALSASIVRAVGTSVVWLNDVVHHGPVVGGTLWTLGGRRLGLSDADGIVRSTTVTDGTVVVTAGAVAPGTGTAPGSALLLRSPAGHWSWGEDPDAPDTRRYRVMLATDRTRFRPSDTIDAWGIVRSRDGATVPQPVTLRISRGWGDEHDGLLVLAQVTAATDRAGAFVATIPISELPVGPYRIQLVVGGLAIASRWFEVDEIRKPSFTVSVSTDRHALLEGDPLEVSVAARFFDGTPVASLPVRFGGEELEGRRVTTGADGTARLTVTTDPADHSGASYRMVQLSSELPEEASTNVEGGDYVVFPSQVVLALTTKLEEDRVSISGLASRLDLEKVERRFAAGDPYDWDAAGAPAPGTPLRVTVIEKWQSRVQTGWTYDYVLKRSVPKVKWVSRARTLLVRDLLSRSDGTFRLTATGMLSSSASIGSHELEVTASARDTEGREVVADSWVWLESAVPDGELRTLAFQLENSGETRRVGEVERIGLLWGGTALEPNGDDRYLHLVLRGGIVDLTVDDSPVYRHRYVEADIPNVTFLATRFDGSSYATSTMQVLVARDPFALKVTVSPSVARTTPGQPVSLAVRVTEPDGTPVAASVVVRAIDARLYAAGYAEPFETIEELYGGQAPGIIGLSSSHRTVLDRVSGHGEGGDTGGGDGGAERGFRSDFRDEPLFRLVRSDATGRATLTMTAPDDITAWRVTASAVSDDGRAGDGRAEVAVGIPLFIEVPIAPEYLAGDRPSLVLRAYGTGLAASTRVTFTVSAPTLGMGAKTVTGTAFDPVTVTLPALTTGDHPVRITARATTAAGAISDALERTLRVVGSRFTTTIDAHLALPAALPPGTGSGITTVLVADEGRGRFLAEAQELARSGMAGGRLEQLFAASMARDLLSEAFDMTPAEDASDPGANLSPYMHVTSDEDSYVVAWSVLPFSSEALEVSARAALLEPDLAGSEGLVEYLRRILVDSTAGAATRERGILALAGLAMLTTAEESGVRQWAQHALSGGDPLETIRSLLDEVGAAELTPRELLVLAVAAARLGDGATARAIVGPLVAASGERLGPWVRLAVPGGEDAVVEATWLLAIVAAEVGDPISEAARAYVEENPGVMIRPLEQAAWLRASVASAPSGPSTYAWTIDGMRRTDTLGAGEVRRFELTPAQRASFSVEQLAGAVGVTLEWAEPVSPASLTVDPALSITRKVEPAAPIAANAAVRVTIRTRVGTGLQLTGCHLVTDLVPSGLQPTTWDGRFDRESDELSPWSISGQRVTFCASTEPLVYYARVVTPGRYRWEPALLQLAGALDHVAMTEAITLRISAP